MKLADAHDGTVYCTRGRSVGVWREGEGFDALGTLPNPETGRDRLPFEFMNRRLTKRVFRPVTGVWTSTNAWPLDGESMLATADHWLFASSDGGRSWDAVRRLPGSAGPMGVLPTSVCRHDGRVYLAEYTIQDEPARILASDDGGRTWTTFLESPQFRHFHGLFHDPYSGRLWGTTGDTDEESAIGFFRDGEFRVVGTGSQRWRAVGLTFTPTSVLWGMDCSYTENVEILRLEREALGTGSPAPDVVETTDSSAFYARTLADGDVTFVAVVTAAEAAVDSTAPPELRENKSGRHARVFVTSSESDYEDWTEVFSFERRRTLSEYTDWIPTSAAYVFLSSDPELGFVVNPFNTRSHHGSVITVSPGRLRRLTGG